MYGDIEEPNEHEIIKALEKQNALLRQALGEFADRNNWYIRNYHPVFAPSNIPWLFAQEALGLDKKAGK